jgi:hypothetical protein
VPVDDGACDHLPGLAIPALVLDSSQGPLDLAELATERLVFPPARNAKEVVAWHSMADQVHASARVFRSR